MRIIGELPGQPYSLRKRDGSDSEDDEPAVDLEEVVTEQAKSAPPVVETSSPMPSTDEPSPNSA